MLNLSPIDHCQYFCVFPRTLCRFSCPFLHPWGKRSSINKRPWRLRSTPSLFYIRHRRPGRGCRGADRKLVSRVGRTEFQGIRTGSRILSPCYLPLGRSWVQSSIKNGTLQTGNLISLRQCLPRFVQLWYRVPLDSTVSLFVSLVPLSSDVLSSDEGHESVRDGDSFFSVNLLKFLPSWFLTTNGSPTPYTPPLYHGCWLIKYPPLLTDSRHKIHLPGE